MRYIIPLIALLVFIIGCTAFIEKSIEPANEQNNEQGNERIDNPPEGFPDPIINHMIDKPSETPEAMESLKQDSIAPINEPMTQLDQNWKNIELQDVKTKTRFKISDFAGKPILLESFAVWCPICTSQQKKIKELHNEVGDQVVSISLDTDPNEDRNKVLEHINRNSFTWTYAISPPEFTRSLIEEFGIRIVNAPSAPIVLVCEDQSSRFLGSGVKSAQDLKSEISKGC